MTRVFRRGGALVIAVMVLALTASIASADGPGYTTVAEFPGPMFGLNAGRGDSLLVAGPEGPAKLDPDDGDSELIAELPGVSDVIQTGRREYYVITGEGERGPEDGPCPAMALCKIRNGNVTLVADILEWELANDPDESGNPPGEDSMSNPFDLVKFGNKFLVADAGGNNIQLIDKDGDIELVAVLPYEDLETQPLKDAAGCPNPPPGAEFICELPPVMTADPVATTASIGPGGDIYAGELKGVPALPGTSRIWRIDRDARGVHCGTDNEDCSQVNTPPLTSIIEMEFRGNTAYVVEVDEASWLAAEGGGTPGGTVNACRASNGNGGGDDDDDDENGNGTTWTCEEIATGLPFPTAIALQDDSIYVSLIHFFQGPFEVVELTNGNGNDHDEDDD
jgi:hypothetical protein